MNGHALRVPRREGELSRVRLREVGRLRDDLRIVEEGDWVYLPLRGEEPLAGVEGEIVERELPEVAAPGPRDYRELLAHWPAGERDLLPRSYDVVGDIVLVRIPSALAVHGREIGEALLSFVPGARLVGADHGVQGPERRREVQRLAGRGPWRTRHRENGVEFDVDVERAYFSPRLAREHARVAEEVRTGDRVYDLCCGVGPFGLTIARTGRPRRVVAVDSNPAAIELLRATSQRYRLEALVQPVEASVERFLEGAEPVERVVLNLPREGIKYLPSVRSAVAVHGVFHYYEVVDRAARNDRPGALLQALGPPGDWTLQESHLVHPYSPSADLYGFSFVRGGA